MMIPARVPSSTYRIQFHLGFRFADARDLVPYLHDLGISHVYASPRFKARRGSSHGYDVADPSRINSELGTEKEFEELVARLEHYGMELLLDIVPNHMSTSSDNPWWVDVLENGPASPYADFFDIWWGQSASSAAGEIRILAPVLGDHYGRALENQELALKFDDTGLFVAYGDNKFPIDPKTIGPVVEEAIEKLPADDGQEAKTELHHLLSRIARMPDRSAASPKDLQRRGRASQQVKRALWELYRHSQPVHKAIDAALFAFNGVRGAPESFQRLDRLLNQQAYRLVYWKLADKEINYRRFFDVSGLVGVRVELPRVFEARLRSTVALVHGGHITGLRVDHVDGLRDPLEFLQRLQQCTRDLAQHSSANPNFYIIVEKILGEGETLPVEWPVAGTTGYDFLNLINQVFISHRGLKLLRDAYAAFIGSAKPFSEYAYEGNKIVLERFFEGEVEMLARMLERLARRDRYACDLAFSDCRTAVVEVTACLPVYRTYTRDYEVSDVDREYIDLAIREARRRTPPADCDDAVYDFFSRLLRLEVNGEAEDVRAQWLDFVMRWQQFTGAAMAKGLEDTSFYRYAALISLNEVGGNPGTEGKSCAGIHQALEARQQQTPFTLNATSTHDTKRSEDVRARINVLSEIPREWNARLRKWNRLNRPRIGTVNGHPAPIPADEVFIYQTLLGAWPFSADEMPSFKERIAQYLIKAIREDKTHTNWRSPDAAYEDPVLAFADALLNLPADDPFMKDFHRLQQKTAFHGALNSLAQAVLKIMSPGAPDFYQGTEMWDLSLVDPDNRRPVDFAARIHALDELRRQEATDARELVEHLVEHWTDGKIKLYVIHKTLQFRKAHANLFLVGEYLPLAVSGPKRDHVFSFVRRSGSEWGLVATPRLTTQVTPTDTFPLGESAWGRNTLIELPSDAPARWHSLFTGEELNAMRPRRHAHRVLRLATVFQTFPVAILSPEN
jgi:(1->4)-alpha-D-glucan 1-alpha-D-glucosylmutase